MLKFRKDKIKALPRARSRSIEDIEAEFSELDHLRQVRDRAIKLHPASRKTPAPPTRPVHLAGAAPPLSAPVAAASVAAGTGTAGTGTAGMANALRQTRRTAGIAVFLSVIALGVAATATWLSLLRFLP